MAHSRASSRLSRISDMSIRRYLSLSVQSGSSEVHHRASFALMKLKPERNMESATKPAEAAALDKTKVRPEAAIREDLRRQLEEIYQRYWKRWCGHAY